MSSDSARHDVLDAPPAPRNPVVSRLKELGLAALVVLLLVLARPNAWSLAVGALLVFLGEAVRMWSAGHLLKTAELVTSGPYRYTRNPLYLGRLLIFTGLTVAAWLPAYGSAVVLLFGWGIFFGYYMPRKERIEPARLKQVHGEPYVRYYEAVPALFPRMRPYAEGGSASWSLERMKRNREQWMVVGELAILLFFLWRSGLLAGVLPG
jgi:protein-S-isoprenylcysteine O-methyltransferase Ste14